MGRRSKASRRFTRNAKDYVWSAVLTNNDDVAPGTETLNILEAADWVAAAGSDRGTLLRIRGSIAFYQTTTAALATTFRWGIFKLNVGETVPDLNAVTSYIDEDILAYGVHQGIHLSTAGDDVIQPVISVDVKAKRKIDTNSVILLAIRPTGNSFMYSATLRALVNRL